MTKLFIATPAYDGKLEIPYVMSLLETRDDLKSKSIPCLFCFRSNGSFLPLERNRILSQFLLTDCTHLLCIDADIGWPPECVYDMIQRDLDFLGICYLTRGQKYFSGIPKFHLDGSLIEKDGLVQMQGIPAGFMLLKRSMIEKMCDHYKDLTYDVIVPGDIPGVALFNSDVVNKKFYGEDILFCKRAIDAGFEIWTDPNVALSHAGAKAYLRDALKNMVGKDAQKDRERSEGRSQGRPEESKKRLEVFEES